MVDASPTMIVELRSIVERLDLAQLFPLPQPLEIELGCGDASFLVEYARQNPEKNFIGVERLLGRISKLHRKGRRAGLTNLRGVRIESSYFLQYLLPPRSASVLHIYFPDPWPKKAPQAPAHQRTVSKTRPRRPRARRRGFFADGRHGLFRANDRNIWRGQGISKN